MKNKKEDDDEAGKEGSQRTDLLPPHIQGILSHPTFWKSTAVREILFSLGFPGFSFTVDGDMTASFR